MKLSRSAILALKGAGKSARERLAEEFKVSDVTVWRWIDENELNGPLTRAAVIQTVSDVTGIKSEEILEQEPETITKDTAA